MLLVKPPALIAQHPAEMMLEGLLAVVATAVAETVHAHWVSAPPWVLNQAAAAAAAAAAAGGVAGGRWRGRQPDAMHSMPPSWSGRLAAECRHP